MGWSTRQMVRTTPEERKSRDNSRFAGPRADAAAVRARARGARQLRGRGVRVLRRPGQAPHVGPLLRDLYLHRGHGAEFTRRSGKGCWWLFFDSVV